MNKVILCGHVGQASKTTYTQSGSAVTKFSLATHQSYKDDSGQWQTSTEWHRITQWVETHYSKGEKLLIEGRISTQSWEKDGEKRYSTSVIAQRVKRLDKRERGDTASGDTDDDIPF